MQVYCQKTEQVEKRSEYNRQHYLDNISWYRARNKQANKNRKEQQEAQNKRRREVREYYRQVSREAHAKNPAPSKIRSNKRRAAKLKRTPVWADKQAIAKFYERCPKGMVVDHVVPLQGRNVSGLHVEYNLQYLTEYENLVKGNKFGS